MCVYEITLKFYQKSAPLSPERCDAFLDRWIEKIEDLKLQFGGTTHMETGILNGGIDFGDRIKEITIEKKLFELQAWLAAQPSRPVILKLKLFELEEE